MLPRWLVKAPRPDGLKTIGATLRDNSDKLVTHFDVYSFLRSVLVFPEVLPSAAVRTKDPSNPRLPLPTESHIMSSLQKPLTFYNVGAESVPDDRDCQGANVAVEFCTCLPWVTVTDEPKLREQLLRRAVVEHQRILATVPVDPVSHSSRCKPLDESVARSSTAAMELQRWPSQYRPPDQGVFKAVWMKPRADVAKIRYHSRRTEDADESLFIATFSVRHVHSELDIGAEATVNDNAGNVVNFERRRDDVEMKDEHITILSLDRVDGMKKKCGVTEKVAEHLCECV